MIKGWPVVVPKGQFALNELILYFEIGSFLPFHDKRYEPYRSSHTSAELHGEKGWVVQTVKLAGHISQGMVFHIDDHFPEVIRIKKKISDQGVYSGILFANLGYKHLSLVDMALREKDLTEELRVKRWATFREWSNGPRLLAFRRKTD